MKTNFRFVSLPHGINEMWSQQVLKTNLNSDHQSAALIALQVNNICATT